MVLDATNVYWVNEAAVGQGAPAILRVPLAGGTVTPVVATLNARPQSLLLLGSDLCWHHGQAILRVSTSGGTPTVAFQRDMTVMAITAYDGILHWASLNEPTGVRFSLAAPQTQGGIRDYAGIGIRHNVRAMAVDKDFVYWLNETIYTQSLFDFVWLSHAISHLPLHLAVARGIAHWTDEWTDEATAQTVGRIMRVGGDGGAAVTLSARPGLTGGLALEGTNLYFTRTATGRVATVSTAGGPEITLAEGQANPTGIAANESEVFWTNNGTDNTNGALMKAPR